MMHHQEKILSPKEKMVEKIMLIIAGLLLAACFLKVVFI